MKVSVRGGAIWVAAMEPVYPAAAVSAAVSAAAAAAVVVVPVVVPVALSVRVADQAMSSSAFIDRVCL